MPEQAQERQLYHLQRADGVWATLQRESGTWKWRRIHGGEGNDAVGEGGWNSLQDWLGGKPNLNA